MKYRELLKKYYAGELSAQEAALVEADLEKHGAIMDHLLQDMETDDPSIPEIPEQAVDTSTDFVKMVNNSIRRAFVVAGAVTAAVVLTLVLVLPHVVSLFFYNPAEVVGVSDYGQETSRMSLDLAVFTELFLPGKFRDTVYAEPEGYGEYTITIPQTSSATGIFTNVAGRLERGTLQLYDPNLLKYPYHNVFVYPDEAHCGPHGMGAAGDAEEALAKLQTLDENRTYCAYFSLHELTAYEDFYQWYYNFYHNGLEFWCGVYTNCSGDHIGFSPIRGGSVMDWDRQKYPLLNTLDSNGSIEAIETAAADGDSMQTHFTSMLRYMQDNPEVVEMFCANEMDWEGIIRYVEENGLQIYGFCVTTNLETIREIANAPIISYVYTTPVD